MSRSGVCERMPLSAAELAELLEPHAKGPCDFVKYTYEQRLVPHSVLDLSGIAESTPALKSIYNVWPKMSISRTTVSKALLILKAKNCRTSWA